MNHVTRKSSLWSATVLCVLAGWLAVLPAAGDEKAVVFRDDFSSGPDDRWSHRAVARAENGNPALGPFDNQYVQLTLGELPEHEFLRVECTLHLGSGWGRNLGAEEWTLYVGRRPVVQTGFNCVRPGARRGPVSAQERLVRGLAWIGQRFPSSSPGGRFSPRTAFENPARTSDDLRDLQGGRLRISVTVPHSDANALLGFRGRYLAAEDATWSLAEVTVETLGGVKNADEEMLRSAWERLADPNNLSAMRAMGRLVRADLVTARFLENRFLPPADDSDVSDLIEQLDDPDFRVREGATRTLTARGKRIRSQLLAASRETDSPEVKGRLRLILGSLGTAELPAGERLRFARAIEVMRWMDSEMPTATLKGIALTSPYREMRTYARGALVARVSADVEKLTARAKQALMAKQWSQAKRLYRRGWELIEGDVFDGTHLADRRAELAHILGGIDRVTSLYAKSHSRPEDDKASEALLHRLAYTLDAPTLVYDYHPAAPKDDGQSPLSRRARMDRVDSLWELEPRELLEIANDCLRAPDMPDRTVEKRFLLRRGVRCARVALQMLRPTKEEKLRATGVGLLREGVGRLARLSQDRQCWVDLLAADGDLGPVAINGTWRAGTDGVSVSSGSFRTLTLPLPARGSYALSVEFERTAGNDGIFIAFPVLPVGAERAHRGNLNLGGWGGKCSGLERINGRQANRNATTFKPGGIITGKQHRVDVLAMVTDGDSPDVGISTWLDGRRKIRWRGEPSDLSTSSVWRTSASKRLFVLGAHMSDVTFRRAEIYPLAGLVPEPVPAGKADGRWVYSAIPPE